MNWRSLTYEKAIKKVKVTAKVLRKPLYNYADGKKKFGSENKKLKTTWWYERLDRAKSTCFARVNTAPKLIAYLLRYMTEFFIKEKVSERKSEKPENPAYVGGGMKELQWEWVHQVFIALFIFLSQAQW